nr:MAG TPA: hypothetical protein [Caudoviricetes sp.]
MAIRTTATPRTLLEFVRILHLTNEEGDIMPFLKIGEIATPKTIY